MRVAPILTAAALLAPLAAQEPPNLSPAKEVSKLHRLVGDWIGKGTIHPFPDDKTTIPFQCTARVRKVLGGHFIREDLLVLDQSTPKDRRIAMRTYSGWDKQNEEYVSLSINSAGAVDRGVFEFDGPNTLVAWNQQHQGGKTIRSRWVFEFVDDDTRTITGYRSIGAGKEFVTMRGRYTRATKVADVAKVAAARQGFENTADRARVSDEITKFARMAGKYKMKGAMVPAPGAPEMQITGSEHVSSIFGGALVKFSSKGDPIEGVPFQYEGFAYVAWVPQKKRYQMIYVNNMGESNTQPMWFDGDDKIYALFSGRHQGKPQSIRSWFQLDAKGAITATYADTTVGTADAKRTWSATYTKQ